MEPEKVEEHKISAEYRLRELKVRQTQASETLNRLTFRFWGISISMIAGGGFTGALFLLSSKGQATSWEAFILFLLPKVTIGVLFGAFMYWYIITLWQFSARNRLRRIELELSKFDTDELQDRIEENFFTKLVQINFKYLDQYYLQTQEQADKSFRLASFACVIGLMIVIVGIIMMFLNKTEPAYVTTGSGVLSEFIAAIFFYLYNRTILKMSQYHQKLVITQNISLALKITDEMQQEQKAKSLEMLIDRLTTDVNKYLTESKD
jgi:hypothetical protein